jgi:hypothetical protein
MAMVNRKRFRLLTAWILAAVLVTAFGSDAFAAAGSKVWGHRSTSLGKTSPSLTAQARKPSVRPYSGEPDVPSTSPQPNTAKDGGAAAGSQLPNWQQVLQGLLPLLGGQRLP